MGPEQLDHLQASLEAEVFFFYCGFFCSVRAGGVFAVVVVVVAV